MIHLNESILSKNADIYKDDQDGFSTNFKIYEIGKFVEFLERKGFKWCPLVKTMDPNNLGKSFGNHRCYSEGQIIGKIDKKTLSRIGSQNSTSDIPGWFAFGDENRVYKITVLKLNETTGHIEYEFECQQQGVKGRVITMVFQNYMQFIDSATRYFHLK